MPEKFPHYVFAEYNIYCKLVCSLLGVILIIVQSGCYTTRVTQSLNQEKIVAPHTELPVLKAGQLIRMTYVYGKKVRRWEGRLKSVTMEGVIIPQKQPGKLIGEDVFILRYRIKRIDILDSKLDVVTTVFASTAGGLILYLVIFFLSVPIGFE